MVMQAMRLGASNKIIKYSLFGVLLAAAIGLAMSDSTGLLRSAGGVSSHDVAKAGDQSLPLQTFDRNLRSALGRLGIPPNEAFKLGYVDQFVSGELRSMILTQAAEDVGVTIGRPRVAAQIMTMIQPMVRDGQNPKDVLNQVLTSQGMSESDLVESITREMTTSLIAGTVQNGFATLSDPLLTDLYKISNETRSVRYVSFLDKDIKSLPAPSDEDLKKLYESSKENFSIPEIRTLSLVKLNEAAVRKTISVSKEEVLQAYEQTKENYFTPAARVLDEALFDTEDQAKKVHEAVTGGMGLESAVTKITGRNIAYLGVKTVSETDIMPEIKDAVLAAEKPGTALPPLGTAVGWYVVVVKKSRAASYKPFDELRKELEQEIFDNKLSDAVYDIGSQVDDLLAGGAALDEIKKQIDVSIIDLPAITATGQDAQGSNALKAYEKIAPVILETGFGLGEGETSPVAEMPDGTYAAVHVRAFQPKTYKPYDDVKSSLTERWSAETARTENRGLVNKYLADFKAGKETLTSIAQSSGKSEKSASFSRRDAPPAPLGPDVAPVLFGVSKDQPVLLPAEGGLVMAVVTDINWPENVNTSGAAFKKFRDEALRDTQNEALASYIEGKARKYNAVVNNNLLKKAYGKSQED